MIVSVVSRKLILSSSALTQSEASMEDKQTRCSTGAPRSQRFASTLSLMVWSVRFSPQRLVFSTNQTPQTSLAVRKAVIWNSVRQLISWLCRVHRSTLHRQFYNSHSLTHNNFLTLPNFPRRRTLCLRRSVQGLPPRKH